MKVLAVLGAVVGIIVWVFVAVEFSNIAELKGHDGSKYLWWTLFLGPVGMMMVIALPQQIHIPSVPAPVAQTVPEQVKKSLADELPDI